MRDALLVAVIALAAGPLAAVEIQLSSDPPLPVANLAQNPGMEEGQDDQPAHWRWGTATPDNFVTEWADTGQTGARSLYLKAHSGKMSGYWSQAVEVEPGREHVFKGFYRLGGGRILCRVHGKAQQGAELAQVDERVYFGSMRGHWLVPVFIPEEALAGADPEEWYPFRVAAKIPEELRSVSLSVGMYFTPGEVSFDDVWFGLARTTLKVKIEAGEDQLKEIRIWSDQREEPLFASPEGASLPATFEKVLEDVPADAVYRVGVTTADGQRTARDYPEQGGD